MAKIDIGLNVNERSQVANALKTLLADTYALYIKTHVYHWNVTGPNFQSLHTMFEVQYNEMWLALDEIAERIRALGHFAPANGAMKSDIADDQAASDQPPEASIMLENLLAGHEALIRRAREALSKAGDVGDAASEDLITVRLQIHEKTAWMLRSMVS